MYIKCNKTDNAEDKKYLQVLQNAEFSASNGKGKWDKITF